MYRIRKYALSGEPTGNLLALHLAGGHANSPAGSAFDGDAFADYRPGSFNQFLRLDLPPLISAGAKSPLQQSTA